MGKKILKKTEKLGKKILATEGKKISKFAIASLVLGIISVILGWIPIAGLIFVIPTLVFSILALIKIKKGEVSGKNIAVAGLVLGGIGLLLAIMFWVFVYMSIDDETLCKDMDCFIAKANQCEPAVYDETTEMGSIRYFSVKKEDTDNCILVKEIEDLSENEDSLIKKVLEGKTMECTYTKGNFNNRWMTSMTSGLEDCHGELKDVLGPLILLTL